MDPIAEKIGTQVKMFRKQKNMTQALLAEKSYISTDFISRVERGVNIASVNTLNSICHALDVDLSVLLNLDSQAPIDKEISVIKNLLQNCDHKTLSCITTVIENLIKILDEDKGYKKQDTLVIK